MFLVPHLPFPLQFRRARRGQVFSTGCATLNDYSAQRTGLNCNAELWGRSIKLLSAHLFQGTCEALLNLFIVRRPGKEDLYDNRNMYGAAAGDLSQGLGIQLPINEAGLLFD